MCSSDLFPSHDTVGQTITMISPFKDDKQTEFRGDKNNLNDKPLDSDENCKDKKAMIQIKDAAGQLVRMVAEKDKEMVEVVSKNNDQGSGKLKRVSNVNLVTEKGKVKATIESEDRDSKNKLFIGLDTQKGEIEVSLGIGGTVKSYFKISESGVDISTVGNCILS